MGVEVQDWCVQLLQWTFRRETPLSGKMKGLIWIVSSDEQIRKWKECDARAGGGRERSLGISSASKFVFVSCWSWPWHMYSPAASGSYQVAIRSVYREGAVGLAKPSMSASQKSGISRLSKDRLRSQHRTSLFPCTVHLRYGLQHSAFVQYADHYQLKRASPLHAQPRLKLLSCPDHWRTKYQSRRHNA